jgi:phosphatidylglycerol:prolipoprotein diacylglycerol transferase
MCSELWRIPYEAGGVPLFGFGVLLAVWAVASVWLLVAAVRRQGWNAETWSLVLPLAFVGAAILFLPKYFPEGLPIRGYGVMLLVGSAAGIGLAIYRARQVGLDSEVIISLAMVTFLCGIVGARLFYVIEYWNEQFANDSMFTTLGRILQFTEGGLVIYGALVGAAAALVWFARKHKLPLFALADLIAPSLAIGLAFGRIGCFLNGCCYGGESDLPWTVTFPKFSSPYEATKVEPRLSPPYSDQAAQGKMYGFTLKARDGGKVEVARILPNSLAAAAGLRLGDEIASLNGLPIASIAEAQQQIFTSFSTRRPLRLKLVSRQPVEIGPAPLPDRSRPVHPAQLYSAVDAGLLAWLLWAYYPFRRRDGEVIALLLIIHPVTRFLLEIIRVDESAVFGTGLSISQNISIALFVGGVAMWIYLSRRPRRATWAGQ